MFVAIVCSVVLVTAVAVAFSLLPQKAKKNIGTATAVIAAVVAFSILFGGVFYGALAEEEFRELTATIISVDGDEVTVNTEDREEYRYYADLSVRLVVRNDEVIDVVLEEKVEATLVGFSFSRSTFILETKEGELEEFFFEEGAYRIGDKYHVYYAEGYAPRCVKVEE